MIKFVYGLQSAYDSLEVKNDEYLYCLTDTHRIYKGESLIVETNVVFMTSKPLPETSAEGILYVSTVDGKTSLWIKSGEEVVQVGGGEATEIADGSVTFSKFAVGLIAKDLNSPNDETIPTTKAVKDAIEQAVSDLNLSEYDEAFTGVSVAPNGSDGETGVILTFTRKSGESPVEIKIADLFLSAASYDPESHMLSLTVKGQEDPVQVDLSDLVGGDVTTDTVKMAKNIVCTVDVGNFKRGQTIDVGSTDTLQKFLVGMLSQDSNPVTKQPSATITLTGAGAIEVGTEFTPKYSASLNPGSYSDNADGSQPTEVTATSYAVSDTSDHSADTQSGQFDPFTVADDTNYKVSVTIQHSDGAVPTTFLGTPYPDGQIKAGSVSASSGSVTGYRQGFYGSLTEKTGEVNSELVRGLSGKTNKKVAKGQKYTISVPTGTMRIVLAYDATVGDVSSITSDEQFGSEIKDSFVKQTVSVLDASGANGKDYNVYVKDLASAQVTGTNYQVTI